MSSNSLALPSSRNWGSGNEYRASSPDDHDRNQDRSYGVPWPLYYRVEEGGGMYSPWRLFEERVRTGPYGLIRFPSQPYSPARILVLDGSSEERVNPRLRQFISDSPPRIRDDWHLALAHQEPEKPGLTDEEFKKAMKKLKKQVYNPPYPRRWAWKRSLFDTKSSRGTTSNDEEDEEKNEGKECSICLEAFVPNDRVLVTPCNHMFHNDCLVPWVKGHGQCPVCRFMLCEKRESVSSRNNNYNNINMVSEDNLDIDLINSWLIRAMEEAFNWFNRSH